MRIIHNIESTSIGKTRKKNDDDIYIGKNFATVIDGVSHKSSVMVNGEEVKVAHVITDAIKKIDRENAPEYAKTLNAEEFIQYINMYIRKYYENLGISVEDYKLEATGVIYSLYHNQIWLVGDCSAIYDGKVLENELKIDKIYAEIRRRVIESLLKTGYTKESIFEDDISKKIIREPKTREIYITSKKESDRIRLFTHNIIHGVLLEIGFTEEQILEGNLIEKYENPKVLQEYLKNNPNAKAYGYSVFNGIYTPMENCKIENLPANVKHIRLSSDGFLRPALSKTKDIGTAIRKNRNLAKQDPLGIGECMGTRNAVFYEANALSFDDTSAVDIEIGYIQERDDER